LNGKAFSQQINLYLPEFRPRNDWLSAARCAVLMGGVVLLVGLLSGVDYGRRYLLQQEQAQTQRVLTAQTRVTEQIESSLAGMATDPSLVSEIGEREASLAQLEGTRGTLQNMGVGNIKGFSEHLKNLSRASLEGLWLTRISITSAGATATLEGKALQSSMVPNFVDRLSAGWTESKGWRFSSVSSSADGFGADAASDNESAASDSGALARAGQAIARVGGAIGQVVAPTQGVPLATTDSPAVAGSVERPVYSFVLEASSGR
jgi:hypothetical protein